MVKAALYGVPAYFRMDLWNDPDLDISGQTSLTLQKKYEYTRQLNHKPKNIRPTARLFYHIYRKQNFHLNKASRQIITGAIFFGIISCKYFTTP